MRVEVDHIELQIRMVDIRYKISRVARFSRRIGLISALLFEAQISLRLPIIRFYHHGVGRRIYLRAHTSDVSVFEHIFIEDELDIDLNNPALIVDGGANCGLTSLYFACRYPGSKIIAVEPSRSNCDMIERNVKGLDVEIKRSALWSYNTMLRIENEEEEPWSFRCVEAKHDEPGAFQAYDVPTILSGRMCDLLKLDIEGGEVELFRDPNWLGDVKAIVVEVHGNEADALIRKACKGWKTSRTGEKLLLVREW